MGLQPAASAVSCGKSAVLMQVQGWRNTQSGSRAAATGAIHRAAPCAVVLPGRITPGTEELCSGRRLTSLRVCCARCLMAPRATHQIACDAAAAHRAHALPSTLVARTHCNRVHAPKSSTGTSRGRAKCSCARQKPRLRLIQQLPAPLQPARI